MKKEKYAKLLLQALKLEDKKYLFIQLPSFLQKGDKVVIVSPSSKIDKEFLKGGRKRIESKTVDYMDIRMLIAPANSGNK